MTEQDLKLWEDDVKFIGLLRTEKEQLEQKINNTIEYIENIREYFEEGLQPEFDNIINKLRGE